MSSVGNTISEGHQGPAVDIAVWICFIISGLAILTKILTKLGRQQVGSDDLVMTLTLVRSSTDFYHNVKLIVRSSQRPANRWPCPDKSQRAWAHTTI